MVRPATGVMRERKGLALASTPACLRFGSAEAARRSRDDRAATRGPSRQRRCRRHTRVSRGALDRQRFVARKMLEHRTRPVTTLNRTGTEHPEPMGPDRANDERPFLALAASSSAAFAYARRPFAACWSDGRRALVVAATDALLYIGARLGRTRRHGPRKFSNRFRGPTDGGPCQTLQLLTHFVRPIGFTPQVGRKICASSPRRTANNNRT